MDSPTDATVIGTDGGVEKTTTTTTSTTTGEAGSSENIEDIKRDLAKERDALRDATEKISNLEKNRVQGPYLQSVLVPVMGQASLVNPNPSQDIKDIPDAAN